jgi:hypothetical protein
MHETCFFKFQNKGCCRGIPTTKDKIVTRPYVSCLDLYYVMVKINLNGMDYDEV